MLHVAAYILLYTKLYQTHVLGNEIYYAIAKSKKKSRAKKLVMGDSVAQQFFNNKTTDYPVNSIACNQSISMAGQYLLLHNYLQAGNQVDSIFFIATPFTFSNNLQQVYTFQYFLKPFYNEEYKPLLTNTVKKNVSAIPFHQIASYPLIATTNWAPEFQTVKDSTFTFLSPVSIEYLKKIKDLSKQYNFKIFFLPTPTPESKRGDIKALNMNEAVVNGLKDEFNGYVSTMVFLDDNEFLDKVHLKHPNKYSSIFSQIK